MLPYKTHKPEEYDEEFTDIYLNQYQLFFQWLLRCQYLMKMLFYVFVLTLTYHPNASYLGKWDGW